MLLNQCVVSPRLTDKLALGTIDPETVNPVNVPTAVTLVALVILFCAPELKVPVRVAPALPIVAAFTVAAMIVPDAVNVDPV